MRQPVPQPRSVPPTGLAVLSVLWALIPVLSIGLLAFVPALHGALRLRDRLLWARCAVYAAGIVAGLTLQTEERRLGGVILVLALVATADAFIIRRRVFFPSNEQLAVQAAEGMRRRREDARRIASEDPALARELCIGRPDLVRSYDDGGLVDINEADENVLRQLLELSAPHTEQVLRAREHVGHFSHPLDLASIAGLPAQVVDDVLDRVVVLGDRS